VIVLQSRILYLTFPEIREQIFRHLLKRPTGISIEVPLHDFFPQQGTEISYYWENRPPQNSCNPATVPLASCLSDSSAEVLPVYWNSNPKIPLSPEQLDKVLEDKPRHFGYYWDNTNRMAYTFTKIAPNSFQLHQRSTAKIEKLSPQIISTCKKYAIEATYILYTENTFVFPTEFDLMFTIGRHSLRKLALDRIPGLPSRLGGQQTPRGNEMLIGLLFNRPLDTPFLRTDPLIRFFHQIGMLNAKLLRSIVIRGVFEPHPRSSRCWITLGFQNMIPIYSTILKKACPNLTTLRLHALKNDYLMKWLGGTRFGRNPAASDKVKNAVVRDLVEALPTLRALQLGSDKGLFCNIDDTERLEDDHWGTAEKFVTIVRDRA
jgi:hypothetical protein